MASPEDSAPEAPVAADSSARSTPFPLRRELRRRFGPASLGPRPVLEERRSFNPADVPASGLLSSARLGGGEEERIASSASPSSSSSAPAAAANAASKLESVPPPEPDGRPDDKRSACAWAARMRGRKYALKLSNVAIAWIETTMLVHDRGMSESSATRRRRSCRPNMDVPLRRESTADTRSSACRRVCNLARKQDAPSPAP